ncbi:hybrid sensor histidine kinase/response regulator [Pseudomonas sp.]|uniref:hybrid sensor histidine kinase/response regulator n=1 Tax=Pseudomonas sp. TaxID=306 RepID=UPI00272CC45F|nr:MEDS domain-containing protein [Pseudomonas sp.]
MLHAQTLMDQLQNHVKHGDHLCVICDDPDERLQAATQYVHDGLRQNDFVMYAADSDSLASLRQALVERGVDVEAEIERGALSLLDTYDAYLTNGVFDPESVYQEFEQAIDSALEAGFSGCRFAGEPVWAIDREDLRPGLIEFESRLNMLFRSRKAAGLCVYDKNAWPAEVVREVLRTHPVVVVNDLVCDRNLYYGGPDLFAEQNAAEPQIDWMLSQLRELRRQELRIQLALEAGQLGSWELILSDDSSLRSLRHDQIFGYDQPPDHWGYKLFIEHVLPEDRQHVEAALQHALSTGETWKFECRIRRHNDGAIRWIEAYGRPQSEGRSDRVERLLGIVSDITERKAMQQALIDSDQRKDEFLATLAHELRNPLAPILNVLYLMRRQHEGDPQLERLRGIMERQTGQLTRLVDDLLDVSRITTGRIVLQREEVELGAVLSNAVEATQPLVESSGHRLSVNVPQEPPLLLEGDPARLTQVFVNILNNAAKYTPNGGQIELNAERDRDELVVRVRDNGLGIQSEFIPDIFEMFMQVGQAGERAQGGLGLGLPLARQLLELHGGRIEARSDGLGHGSEFTVRLPSLASRSTQGPTPSQEENEAASRERILVVDDNQDAADSLGMSLELLGHQVSTRYDGFSAIAACERDAYDIVILDIGMPGLDGYQVARAIRERYPDTTLVALTGWGQESDRELAREAAFDLHRTKPADPIELLEAILATRAGERAGAEQ